MKNIFFSLILLLVFTLQTQAQDQGLASAYKNSFQSQATASGELYQKNMLTAAHKDLPMGTMVKVSRNDNKRAVVVRINDRLAADHSSVIQLSGMAASAIGLTGDATARVNLTTMGQSDVNYPSNPLATSATVPTSTISTTVVEQTTTVPANAVIISSEPEMTSKSMPVSISTSASGNYGVQVAAVTSPEGAAKLVEKYEKMWFKDISIYEGFNDQGHLLYKVVLGDFADKAAADTYKKNLKKNKKVNGFVIKMD